jgi:hypothetical protein
MDNDGLRAWVERIRAERRAVMHRRTGRFGAIERFYDGVASVYRSTIDGSLTEGAVIELSSGDAFVVSPETVEATFRELTRAETSFWTMTLSAIATAVGEIAIAGASQRIPEDIGPAMIAAALRYQANVIAGPNGNEVIG